jgi:hypothetical protein
MYVHVSMYLCRYVHKYVPSGSFELLTSRMYCVIQTQKKGLPYNFKRFDVLSNYLIGCQIIWWVIKLFDVLSNYLMVCQIIWQFVKLFDGLSNGLTVSQIIWRFVKLFDGLSNGLMHGRCRQEEACDSPAQLLQPPGADNYLCIIWLEFALILRNTLIEKIRQYMYVHRKMTIAGSLSLSTFLLWETS